MVRSSSFRLVTGALGCPNERRCRASRCGIVEVEIQRGLDEFDFHDFWHTTIIGHHVDARIQRMFAKSISQHLQNTIT